MPYNNIHVKRERQKEYQAVYYARNRELVKAKSAQIRKDRWEWFRKIKEPLCCIKCGESHPATLDFHHRDKSKKLFGIVNGIIKGKTISTILEEMSKCDVLCSNCHRKLHYDEREMV
jgi:hypothetical protein